MRQIRAVLWMLVVLPLWALAAQKMVVEIDVEGMAWPACSARVEKALGKLDGVNGASVSLKDKKARIVFAPGAKPDLGDLRSPSFAETRRACHV